MSRTSETCIGGRGPGSFYTKNTLIKGHRPVVCRLSRYMEPSHHVRHLCHHVPSTSASRSSEVVVHVCFKFTLNEEACEVLYLMGVQIQYTSTFFTISCMSFYQMRIHN